MAYAATERTWFDEVRDSRPSVVDVALHLGLSVRGRRFGPCPCCGKDDARHPPLTLRHGDSGWMCAHCKQTGDVVRLASWVVCNAPKPEVTGWDSVRAVFASAGWCSPSGDGSTWNTPKPRTVLPEAPLPDHDLVWGMLRACRKITDVPGVADYLASRGLPTTIPAAVLPDVYPWPWFWPFGRERIWRLAVSAVDHNGMVRSLHARAVGPSPHGSTRWPFGCRSTRLLFADPVVARPMLRSSTRPAAVLVLEGITDYLAGCVRAPRGTAVLGATSGGFGALSEARIPKDVPIYVGTDNDRTGDRYAEEIKTALRGYNLRRINWTSVK